MFRERMKILDSKDLIWWIIGLGLFLRLVCLAFLFPYPVKGDASAYQWMAEQLVLGNNFTPFYPPGVSYYLSIWYALFGINQPIGRASILLIFVLLVVFVYLLALRLSNRKAANIAAAMIAFYPTFIIQSIEPLTQLPTGLCLVVITYLLLGNGSPRQGISTISLIICGVVLGCLVLIRPSNLLFLFAVPAYIGIRHRSLLRAVTPFFVGVIMLCAWLYKAESMTGRFVMVNDANLSNFFYGNNPYTPLYKTWWFGNHGGGEPEVPKEYTALEQSITSLPPVERDAKFRQITLDHIFSRPDLFIVRSLSRIRSYFAFDTLTGSLLRKNYSLSTGLSLVIIGADAITYSIIMLLVIFFVVTYRTPGPMTENFLLAMAVALTYSAPYWLSFSHPTYHAAIIPLLSVFAGIAAAQMSNESMQKLKELFWTTRTRRIRLSISLVLFFLIQGEWILYNLSRI
jgi:4-amino-4-deoxy-L-arabinose transferase-like glycosyltransferase